MKMMTMIKMTTATARPAYIAALPASAATLTATVQYKEHRSISCQHCIYAKGSTGTFENTEYITYIHDATKTKKLISGINLSTTMLRS